MKRSVVITVTEDDKTFTITLYRESNWPWHEEPPLATMITEAAVVAVRELNRLNAEERT